MGGEELEYSLKVRDSANVIWHVVLMSPKVNFRPQHADMTRGEYESQKAMSEHLPDNSVHPISFETFEFDSSKSFFLTTYRQLKEKTPTQSQLVDVLTQLHSLSSSLTGKFGFYVSLRNEWCDRWESGTAASSGRISHGNRVCEEDDVEFNRVAGEFFVKVIPRLLRLLQSGGRSIKPTLVHGGIWHGYAQVDVYTTR